MVHEITRVERVKEMVIPIALFASLGAFVWAIGIWRKVGDVWGPWASWPEFAFFLYYILLMVLDLVILASWKAIRILEWAPE